jgi:hypothetical protein
MVAGAPESGFTVRDLPLIAVIAPTSRLALEACAASCPHAATAGAGSVHPSPLSSTIAHPILALPIEDLFLAANR